MIGIFRQQRFESRAGLEKNRQKDLNPPDNAGMKITMSRHGKPGPEDREPERAGGPGKKEDPGDQRSPSVDGGSIPEKRG